MKDRGRLSIFTEVDHSFTMMLVGDSFAGKTCLLIRFKDDTFLSNNFISTVGIDYRIWDTAGQERFRSLTTAYYRDADALLLLYDITNRKSFDNVRVWLCEARECAKETVTLTLVGNKCDLKSERKVEYEEGLALAKTYNLSFFETSAKTGENVHEVFEEITRRLIPLSANHKHAEAIKLVNADKNTCCALA